MYNLALMFKHNKPSKNGLGGLGYIPLDYRGMIGGSGFRMKGGMVRVMPRRNRNITIVDEPDEVEKTVEIPVKKTVEIPVKKPVETPEEKTDEPVEEEKTSKQLNDELTISEEDINLVEKNFNWLQGKKEDGNDIVNAGSKRANINKGYKWFNENKPHSSFPELYTVDEDGNDILDDDGNNILDDGKIEEYIEKGKVLIEEKKIKLQNKLNSERSKKYIKNLKSTGHTVLTQDEIDEINASIKKVKSKQRQQGYEEGIQFSKKAEEETSDALPLLKYQEQLARDKEAQLNLTLERTKYELDEDVEKYNETQTKLNVLGTNIDRLEKLIQLILNPNNQYVKDYGNIADVLTLEEETNINEFNFVNALKDYDEFKKYKPLLKFLNTEKEFVKKYGVPVNKGYSMGTGKEKSNTNIVKTLLAVKAGLKAGKNLEYGIIAQAVLELIYDTMKIDYKYIPDGKCFDDLLYSTLKEQFCIDDIDIANKILIECKKYNTYYAYTELRDKFNAQYKLYFSKTKIDIMYMIMEIDNLDTEGKNTDKAIARLEKLFNLLTDDSYEFDVKKFDLRFYANFPYCGISVGINKFPDIDEEDDIDIHNPFGASTKKGFEHINAVRGEDYTFIKGISEKSGEVFITKIKRNTNVKDKGKDIYDKAGKVYNPTNDNSHRYLISVLIKNALVVFDFTRFYKGKKYTPITNLFRGSNDTLDPKKVHNSVLIPFKEFVFIPLNEIYPDLKEFAPREGDE